MTKGKDSSVSGTREMMYWILTQEVRMQILELSGVREWLAPYFGGADLLKVSS